MPGHAVRVVPKRKLDFAGLQTNNTQSVVLADRVEVRDWQEMTMVVRVHSLSLASTGTISIVAQPCSFTDEDPGLTFVSTAGCGPAVVLDASTLNPDLKLGFMRTTGANCVGKQVRIVALGNRTAAGALNATISVEMSGKDGASFLPTRLSSCVLWLHADDYNPTTGGWPDRSGFGYDGAQSTPLARPALETKFNGFKDVLFDGTAQYIVANGVAPRLSGNDIAFSVVYLYEVVSLPAVAGDIYGLGRTSSANPQVRSQAPRKDGAQWDYGAIRFDDTGAGKSGVSAATISAGTKYSVAERFSGTTMKVTVNGTAYLSNVDLDVGPTTLDEMNIGAYSINAFAPSEFLNMRLREFSIFAANISDIDATRVANGMRERAGLPTI